ncbi:MAG: hypothetical protein ABR587_12205 [Candidatus Binatia bacterium]
MPQSQNLGKLMLAFAIGFSLAYPGMAAAGIIVPPQLGPKCGDYTRDESITATDALGALRAAVGVIECRIDICDYNGDDEITASDALAILRTAVGNGPTAKCPVLVCNGPACKPTCADDELDCCDVTTCSGNGKCAVEDDVAVCTCDEGWVGATCNAPAELYPFATEPSREPPVWTGAGNLFVRPPSYGEQMRHDLRPGTFFIANSALIADVTAGEPDTVMPLVFPDGEIGRYNLDLKAEFTSDVRLIERRSEEGAAKIVNRFPQVKIYRSLFESDRSLRSVMQVLAVDEGGLVSRGLASHESNMPNNTGLFSMTVTPVGPAMRLDDIEAVGVGVDDSTLLISEAFFANAHQAELFDDCGGQPFCSELCADTGLDVGDPGPACPSPPDPCEHSSPCGDGHGSGEPPATHQCNDGDDNDGDELVDGFDPECDHTPFCEPGGDIPQHFHTFEAGSDFGLFGDVRWCTKKGDSWPAFLLDRGYYTETPYHTNTGFPAYDNLFKWGDAFYSIHEKLVRLRTIGCWRLPTEEEAEDCSDNLADCGPFAAGAHTYPYRFGRDAEGMWDGLKVDVWHARSVGMDDPLNNAQTLAGTLIGNSEAESIPGFASVVGNNVNGQDANPHELGHTLNLTHCDARKVGNLWTLMGNSTQVQTCPPGEWGNAQLNQFSNASGEKLFNCFLNGCLRDPNFGDPTP